MANFGTAVFTAILNAAPLAAGATAAGGALATFGATATRIGAGMTTALSLPLAAVGASMVSESIKIENAWNEVRATYNATPAEIEKLITPHGDLGRAVTDLSLKYGLARDEVIDLLGQLSQMGFTGKKATDTLKQGLEFAVAAGLKLQDGLNLAVAITNTFGLEGQNLTNTLRSLNVVENDTAAGGFDLMKALTRAGGAAEAMTGPTFTSRDAVASLAAGMAVLKANGQETARSADALRAIFQRIYTPTDKVQALFDKMGVKLHTAKGEIVPFPELLQNLADNFNKLTPYERMQFGKQSIGVEFGPLLQTLIKDVQKGSDGMSIYNNTLKDFNNTAKGSAAYANELKVRQNSLAVATGRIKAAWGLLVDSMRPAIGSVLKPLANGFANLVKMFANASPATKQFAVIFGLIITVAGPLILLIGLLVTAIGAIGGPVLAVVAGVGALVGAFIAVIKRGGPVANFVKNVLGTAWDNLKAGLGSLVGAFKALIPYFKVVGFLLGGSLLAAIYVLSYAFRFLAWVIEGIAKVVGWVFKGIIKIAQWMYDVLVGHSIIPDLINAIIFWFNLLFSTIVPIVTTLWNVIVTIFQTAVSVIGSVVSFLKDLVVAVFNVLMTVIGSIINIIVTIVVAAFKNMVALAQLAWTTLVTVIQTALTVLSTIVQTLINVVVAILKFAWSVIQAGARLAWTVIQTIIQTVMGVIRGIINVFMGLITGDWSRAWNGIKQIVTAIWNGIKGLWNAFWSFLKSVGSSALTAIKSIWTSVWNGIKAVVTSIWNAIKSLWSSFWSTMKSLGQNAMNVIKSVVTGFINTVKSVITNGINVAKSAWSNGWSAFKSIVSGAISVIKGIINGLIGVVNNVVNKVSGALSKIKGAAGKVGSFLGFNTGGLVPGSGNKDTVPAMLTPGEFVVTKSAVKRIGAANLIRLNRSRGGSDVLNGDATGTGVGAAREAASATDLARKAASRVKVTQVATEARRAPVEMINTLKYLAEQRQAAGNTYQFQTAVYNPIAEKASDSVQRKVTRLADMGMFASADKGGN